MIGRVFCKLVSLCTWMNCCGDAPTDGPGLESCKADSKASANVEDRSEAAVSYMLTMYPNVMTLARHGAFSSRGFFKSSGKKSRSHIFLLSAVYVLKASPPSPCTATMLYNRQQYHGCGQHFARTRHHIGLYGPTSSSKGRVEDVNAQCIGLRWSAVTRHVGG
jgi:hypothetical protein